MRSGFSCWTSRRGVLRPPETSELFRMIRSFAEDGGAVVLITHKLDEALRAADRVTVLRAGAVTYAGTVAGQSVQSLTSAMIGQPVLPSLAASCRLQPSSQISAQSW